MRMGDKRIRYLRHTNIHGRLVGNFVNLVRAGECVHVHPGGARGGGLLPTKPGRNSPLPFFTKLHLK